VTRGHILLHPANDRTQLWYHFWKYILWLREL